MISIDLTPEELALLFHLLNDRINAAYDAGVPDDDSSSVFRKTLRDKLTIARRNNPER